MKPKVRITNVAIKNFKNVNFGELSFVNNRKNFKASILGLYGQNGSGKTALIDALELLKYVLCAMEIPDKFADFINVDSDSAEISYSFDITLNETIYPVVYRLALGREIVQVDGNAELFIEEESKYKVKILNEEFHCQTRTPDGKLRMGRMIDTKSTVTVFVPVSKYELLVGRSKETSTDLLVSKKLSQKTAKTFVFSKDLLNAVRSNATNQNAGDEKKTEASHYLTLLEALVEFGNIELFVINTANAGLISLNTQPLVFKIRSKENEAKGTLGTIALLIDKPSIIPEDMYHVTETVIENMNIVLEKIIPGLTIAVKDLGNQTMPNGMIGKRVELVSRKNSREIPLKYESEGIKKIVSILQLLVVVYNQESITVAIDELDSGVFEYLLGEILRIISEKGKGQLIFTSHNLRPLETIDRGFVAFTTTNPDKRYIRLANVKENHNLRDFYYRDIMLGEQDEAVYDLTNNAEIALAFREAGESIGS
ncbi:MAG: AAA family ATPase [Clostridia bacterium]